MRKPKTVEDFLKYTEAVDGCLIWSRALNTDGYPRAVIRGNSNGKVHREVYSLSHPEEDITGLVIRHTCDNPKCINPEHLLSGTNKDNMNDRDTRNRGHAMFTHDQVREIRSLYDAGTHGQTDIARLFTTKQGSIRQIVKRISYKYVE